MQYIDAPRAPQNTPSHGADKYHGDVSRGYDAKRENTPKWTVEQRIIEDMLAELPKGSTVLDIPVGTGRFLQAYKRLGLKFIGADISGDQLIQSALKLVSEDQVENWVTQSNAANTILPLRIGQDNVLVQGSILEIGLDDKSVDAAVMCRITRWIIGEHGPVGIQRMLREAQRVCRDRFILTARVANHKWAVSQDLIESALDGWKITANVAGYETDYRILQVRPS